MRSGEIYLRICLRDIKIFLCENVDLVLRVNFQVFFSGCNDSEFAENL